MAKACSKVQQALYSYRLRQVHIKESFWPHAYQIGKGVQLKLLNLRRRHPAGLQSQGAEVLQRLQVVKARIGHSGVRHVQ
jgi:hypothetical protein